jgi:hypothetical protein
MRRNLILIGVAILLAAGGWIYAENMKSAQAAAQEKAMSSANKSECCAPAKTTADAGKGCCETKK